jgi:signal transduction histidine kinase
MSTRPFHLLLVEDDDIDREKIHRLIGSTYLITDAASGAEAIAALATTTFDCALLDYRLPDSDAPSLLATMQAEDIPVVILTNLESPDLLVQALHQGAQDYLVKHSLTMVRLIHAITHAVERVALQRRLADQQNRLNEQAAGLAQKNSQILQLASALTLAEQQERHRVAQILHDDLQQLLYGVQMRAHLLKTELLATGQGPPNEQLHAITELVNQAIQTTRSLAVELSPPVLPSEGLRGLLRWLAATMSELHGLKLHLTVDEKCEPVDDDLRLVAFQLVRELVFNIVKHAGVTEAHLTATGDEETIHILVEDKGVGSHSSDQLDPNKTRSGFGLWQARERLQLFGGQLDFHSEPGLGTRASIILPHSRPH